MLENIRISTEAKGRLSALKRKTGIDQWNILCRWAFCLSLAEPKVPQKTDISTDSNVEMTWQTFAGRESASLYLELIKMRCIHDGLPVDEETVAQQFKLHLHRGIGYLSASGKIKNLPDLLALALHNASRENP